MSGNLVVTVLKFKRLGRVAAWPRVAANKILVKLPLWRRGRTPLKTPNPYIVGSRGASQLRGSLLGIPLGYKANYL